MSCPLGLSAVRACCPALCRCSISTLRFFGSSSPITLLPSILSVYLLRYVLFYSFLLFVTFLRLFDTFLFYGSISPFIPFIPSPYYIPPIVPPFLSPFPFPPVSPFFPVSRGFSGLFGSFRWSWSGPGGAGSQAVTLAFGRRSGRRSCLLRLCLLSFSAVLVSSFCASFPSALVPAPALRYSGLVFFARAGRGMVRADLHKKSGAAALVRRRRSWACILFSGCKGQDDYCGADQAINSCSHVFPVSVNKSHFRGLRSEVRRGGRSVRIPLVTLQSRHSSGRERP